MQPVYVSEETRIPCTEPKPQCNLYNFRSGAKIAAIIINYTCIQQELVEHALPSTHWCLGVCVCVCVCV
jgi:hypothetical protein